MRGQANRGQAEYDWELLLLYRAMYTLSTEGYCLGICHSLPRMYMLHMMCMISTASAASVMLHHTNLFPWRNLCLLHCVHILYVYAIMHSRRAL